MITAEQGARTIIHMAQSNLSRFEIDGHDVVNHKDNCENPEWCPISASLRIVEKGLEHHTRNWENGVIDPMIMELADEIYHSLAKDGILE